VCYSDKMSDGINQIVSEKLDKNNFHAWKFRMTNFLMGKGFWDYVEGENEDPTFWLGTNHLHVSTYLVVIKCITYLVS